MKIWFLLQRQFLVVKTVEVMLLIHTKPLNSS